MQLLCIAALLLSAVAAQTPGQDEVFTPPDEIELDEESQIGGDEQWVTGAPEDDLGTSGEWPEWAAVRASGLLDDEPGFPQRGVGRRFGRPRGGRRPNRRNPCTQVFTPKFKVDKVTFQNDTDVALHQGESLFLQVKLGGRRPHSHRGGKRRPPMNVQYVKLIYNATEPNQVSVEYGVVEPKNLRAREIENQEDDY